MPDPLENRHIALGVTGSIACYKSVDLASKLIQAGALVDVIMTESATHFLSPLTFRSITQRPVVTNLFDPQSELSMDHVAIAQRVDLIVVAPATANTLAKIAWGLADDALLSTILASSAPLILAPAMDAHMYENPATQENMDRLKARGHVIVGPAEGHLASGMVGRGRMLEPQELLGHIRMVLGGKGDLSGMTVVVSSGGTRESLDPVRFISNRSSGKMGYAVAEAARDRGARVVLVSAATDLAIPVGVQAVHVETALEMRNVVRQECEGADALVMTAAVADWRPVKTANDKLKKSSSETWAPELTRTPDILSEIESDGLVKVGFAAESQNLVANAEVKLISKGLDLIVANDITAEGSTFGADTNKVVLLDRGGGVEELPLMTKYEVSHHILDRVAVMLKQPRVKPPLS